MNELKQQTTDRGFKFGEFYDQYNNKCSIQQSSIADEPCIWLGVDDANPQILASKAKQFGLETEETTGWIPYPVPKDVLLSTRMHLSEENVKMLVGALQNWLDTGNFSKDEE